VALRSMLCPPKRFRAQGSDCRLTVTVSADRRWRLIVTVSADRRGRGRLGSRDSGAYQTKTRRQNPTAPTQPTLARDSVMPRVASPLRTTARVGAGGVHTRVNN
jgi:hypothetical protein